MKGSRTACALLRPSGVGPTQRSQRRPSVPPPRPLRGGRGFCGLVAPGCFCCATGEALIQNGAPSVVWGLSLASGALLRRAIGCQAGLVGSVCEGPSRGRMPQLLGAPGAVRSASICLYLHLHTQIIVHILIHAYVSRHVLVHMHIHIHMHISVCSLCVCI